jgi:hypothetical protein
MKKKVESKAKHTGRQTDKLQNEMDSCVTRMIEERIPKMFCSMKVKGKYQIGRL